jgi:hypothetical protein
MVKPVMSNRQAALVESLDWLFGQLPDKMTGHVIPAEVFDGLGRGPTPLPPTLQARRAQALAAPPQPPPALETPEDLRLAHEWFQVERARLEEYTRQQFADIEAQQQAGMSRFYQGEAALAARSREINREMQFLAAQSQALQARARELADWESQLSTQMARLTQAQGELLYIQTTSANIQRDTELQQASLLQLRQEAAQLQTQEAAARDSFAAFDQALADRQRAWEQKQADMAARQQAMEQRYQALEQAEAAAKRRLAELDDLEDHLRQEFDNQQQQLLRERQELDALYAEVRQRDLAPARQVHHQPGHDLQARPVMSTRPLSPCRLT